MRIAKLFPILLTVALTASCGSGASTSDGADVSLIKNPNTPEGVDASVKMPRLTFDCDQHDFGRLTPGESISYSFHFRNDGNDDLIISGCDASCGCTVADYPKGRVTPGGDGYVTVHFSSAGKTGQQLHEVYVRSNAQPALVKLRIIAQIGH